MSSYFRPYRIGKSWIASGFHPYNDMKYLRAKRTKNTFALKKRAKMLSFIKFGSKDSVGEQKNSTKCTVFRSKYQKVEILNKPMEKMKTSVRIPPKFFALKKRAKMLSFIKFGPKDSVGEQKNSTKCTVFRSKYKKIGMLK